MRWLIVLRLVNDTDGRAVRFADLLDPPDSPNAKGALRPDLSCGSFLEHATTYPRRIVRICVVFNPPDGQRVLALTQLKGLGQKADHLVVVIRVSAELIPPHVPHDPVIVRQVGDLAARHT